MSDYTQLARIVKRAAGGFMIRLGKGRYIDLPDASQMIGAKSPVKNYVPANYIKTRKALALAYAGVSGTSVLMLGNSTTAPLFVDSISKYCPTAQLVKILRDVHGLPASGNTYLGGVSLSTVNPAADSRMVFAASPAWSMGNVTCAGGACPRSPAGQTSPATFHPYAGDECDAFDVYYAYTAGSGGAGTFDLRVNAEATMTVQKTTVATVGKASITSTLKDNTLTITPGGQTETVLMGIAGRKTSRAEILFWNGGLGGSIFSQWFRQSYPNYWREHIIKISPVLTHVRGSINDWKNNTLTGIEEFRQKVTEGIAWLLANGFEVLIEIDPPSDVTQASLPQQRQYAQVLIDCANENGLAYIDHHADIESFSAIGGVASGAYLDTLHPDKWLYSEIARRQSAFYSMLLGSV